MARFPKREAQIMALAEQMIAGLAANPAIFPNPPHRPFGPVVSIRWKSNQYSQRRQELIAAQAAAEVAVADKDEALETLIEGLKADIRYAENTVDFDDDKLKLIGWAGRKAASPLPPPGQTRLLEAPRQGAGWVFLDWKAPAEGGKPAAYEVQRRSGAGGGSWKQEATAIATKATLVDQPRGAQLEYRVIAINKAGAGPPSNTVMVVL